MKYLVLCAPLLGGTALADDQDALRLADNAPQTVQSARDWQASAELAYGRAALRQDALSSQRLSLEFALDTVLAPGWRALFSDRLDLNWQDQAPTRKNINTLKQAYLSWQANAGSLFDLGRINQAQGVASGYNPTDFFRDGALRSVVSADPASLKKNRQGSVLLRGQHLWSDGALTALYAPKLSDSASSADFNPDLGATNHNERWLISLSQQLSAPFSTQLRPQFLLYGQSRQPTQFGLNLTGVLNDSTVLYAEWSGGRKRTQLEQAQGAPAAAAFRQRAAIGITHTRPDKLSLTLEYEYDGAAPGTEAWDALRYGSPPRYAQYRAWQQNAQELPTRQELFAYANWPDALTPHLELSAMLKYNLADQSRLTWLEARYHFDQADLALRWQGNRGERSSAYGAAAQQSAWQILLKYYF